MKMQTTRSQCGASSAWDLYHKQVPLGDLREVPSFRRVEPALFSVAYQPAAAIWLPDILIFIKNLSHSNKFCLTRSLSNRNLFQLISIKMITLLEGDGVFQWETAMPHEKLEPRPWKATPLLISPNISFFFACMW